MFDIHNCKVNKSTLILNDNSSYKEKYYGNDDMYNKYHYDERKVVKHTSAFTIAIDQNIFGLYTIPIVINAHTYHFIIDTGASISGFLDKHIKDMELDVIDNLPIQSAGGAINNADVYCLNRMFMGSLEIKNQPIISLNDDDFKIKYFNKQIIKFDGIIGWDILKELDFRIDSHNLLFSMLDNLPITYTNNLLSSSICLVCVNDDEQNNTLLGLDTGAKICWFSKEYSASKYLDIKKNKNAIQLGVLGIEKVKIQIIKKCKFHLYDKEINLFNTRSGITMIKTDLFVDGILGNEIFEDKIIEFYNSIEFIRII